jgi:localization factor PodJL
MPSCRPGQPVIRLANAGNPTALTIWACVRSMDQWRAVNLPDAVKFLTQAAEKGQAVAQVSFGTLYERGQGVAVDGVKAVHWYGLAAAQGNRKAMHNLAVAYASGIGGKKKHGGGRALVRQGRVLGSFGLPVQPGGSL